MSTRSNSSPDHAWSGKLLLGFLTLLGKLPLRVRRGLGRAIGRVVAFAARRDSRIAELQPRAFLPERQVTAPVEIFSSVGETVMESLNLTPILSRSEHYVKGVSWPLVQELVGSGRPIVALSAHIGNWDLLAGFFASRGIRVAAVGRQARSAVLQVVLERIRARAGFETIWRSGSAGLKSIVSVLRDKGILAVLIDQDTSVASRFSAFFGHPAKTPDSLIDLAKRSDAILVTAFLTREADGTYRIWLERIPDEFDTDQVLGEYHRRLEILVRAYPSQWVWFHKRWRTKPDGTKFSRQEYEAFLSQYSGERQRP